MDKIVLDKYKNDPAWAETIKLNSGLFDTHKERADFIITLSQADTSLAADCELSSVHTNANTIENLKSIAVLKYLNGKLTVAILHLVLLNARFFKLCITVKPFGFY
jgi:hypothetical protein